MIKRTCCSRQFFFALLPLGTSDTAHTLYDQVVMIFSENNIPYIENLICFAAD